jgi:hypoxanthine-guanine phosphoribosyltransferase
MRQIDLRMTIDFMAVSSYKDGTRSTGDVEILKDLSNPIRGKHVIVVEEHCRHRPDPFDDCLRY